jgi:hypothetical protein
MKKLVSIFLAIAILFTFSISAFAESTNIVITDETRTYTAYKLLDVTSSLKSGHTEHPEGQTCDKNCYTYYYTVRAVDNNVLSQYYDGKSIVALNPPTLGIANNKKSIRITWSKINNADGYIVYRAENNKWKKIATIKNNNTFKYEDKKVEPGVTYKYTVKAYDGKLAGAYYSKGVSIMRLEMPHSIKAQRLDSGMQISFAAIPYAQKYRVYRKATTDTKWTSLGYTNTTSFIDNTGVTGVKYIYTVRAINGKSYSYYYKQPVTVVY